MRKKFLSWMLTLVIGAGALDITGGIALAKEPDTLGYEQEVSEDAETLCAGENQVYLTAENFPDAGFRNYLADNYGTDGWVDAASIQRIDVSGLDIKDLTGLERFPNLEWLDCSSTKVTHLDLSKNTKLETLMCNRMDGLYTLDISKNIDLRILYCNFTPLDSLDVSQNTKLRWIMCENANISNLDVSKNADLESLDCQGTRLSSLDVSKNEKLRSLNCGNTHVSYLDLSHNPLLQSLVCYNSDMKKLDLGKNPKLSTLMCERSKLQVLDLSANKDLGYFTCDYDCQITGLDCSRLHYLELNIIGKTDCLDVSRFPSVETLFTETGVYDASKKALKLDVEKWTRPNENYFLYKLGNLDIHARTPSSVDVIYHTHIQTYGDTKGDSKNGQMSGTSGESKRLENIQIKVEGNEYLGIQYTTHCQTYGWLPWSSNWETSGTSGESKRLEAIKIQLTGALKNVYDVYYRVHAQSYGWLGWAKNGEPSGTAGYGKRLEGIQIVVVQKGQAAPGLNYAGVDASKGKHDTRAYIAKKEEAIVIPGSVTEPSVMYKTHVQTYGWQAWRTNGAMSGTSGEAKRLEGINIKLSNCPYEGGIAYTTHVQKYGWQGDESNPATWKKNGEMSGTSGEAKRLEAIRIALTGEMAKHFDVYYRVHAQTYGWLGWAKNGEASGTAGYAKRLEGIQIVLVPKGGAAPANNYGGAVSKDTRAYIKK